MQVVVLKVMNNNVLLGRDVNRQQECMVIGKGIGFGRKTNEVVKLSKDTIEKVYYAEDTAAMNAYMARVSHIDAAIIGVCEELIAEAENALGPMSQQLHAVFIDHIAFAIDRVKSGMVIDNPFIFEIQALYPNEYAFGQKAVSRINREFSVYLPKDEAGYIALHLYAASQNAEVKEAVKQTRILTEVMQYLEQLLSIKMQRHDFSYIRLLNHMRSALERYRKGVKSVNPLMLSIQSDLVEAYRQATLVGQFLMQEYGIEFDQGELGYLAIHLERIQNINDQQSRVTGNQA